MENKILYCKLFCAMLSPMFWHPKIYELTVRAMYRSHFDRRYRLIADLVGELPVLDVCCGDGFLANYLSKTQYQGVDIHLRFLKYGRAKGLAVSYLDVCQDRLPTVPCLVMMASLYQFIPRHRPVVSKLVESAQKKVIISEPIYNFATSKNPFISRLARFLADPVGGTARHRFDEQSLGQLYASLGFQKTIKNGRELVGILEK